jgi:hypothetical protein
MWHHLVKPTKVAQDGRQTIDVDRQVVFVANLTLMLSSASVVCIHPGSLLVSEHSVAKILQTIASAEEFPNESHQQKSRDFPKIQWIHETVYMVGPIYIVEP